MSWLDAADALAARLRTPDSFDKDAASYPTNAANTERDLFDAGIIRQINDFVLNRDGAHIFGSVALYGGWYRGRRFVLPRPSGGSGFTQGEAHMRAIGEAAERTCAAVYDEAEFILSSYRNLPGEAANPVHFALFSESQYGEENFAYRPFTETSSVNWISGYSLLRKSPVLVPAALVYHPYWPVGGEAAIGLLPTTGLACGRSLAEAVLHGLYEVIEREAITIMWLNQLPAPRLDLGGVRDRVLKTLTKGSLANKLAVHDVTTDIGIPTRFALWVDEVDHRPLVSLGAATRHNAEEATEKAIGEALFVSFAIEKMISTNAVRDFGANYHEVKSLEDHMLLFTDPTLKPTLDFLLQQQPSTSSGVIDQAVKGTLAELRSCLVALEAKGLEVILVDLTLPEVAEAGLTVVRVLVPGMIPLNFGAQYVCKGGKRLYEVPASLGSQVGSVREQDLNPIPHPFA